MNKVWEIGRLTKEPEIRYTSKKNGYGAGFCEGVREAFSKQDQEKEKEWSLILRLPKEVIDFCDKFNTGQGNMYNTPIDFRKFSSGYLDGKCFGEQKRLQPARHASTI